MVSRRGFMTGLLATGIIARPTWADVGSPAFLSAARLADASYALFGITTTGAVAFQIALPSRGHAGAAHPRRAQAVAFARRPGNFALVIDCQSGVVAQELQAPAGRHFYGHGTYSTDGTRLFTTENDFDAARGVIGVWGVDRGYQRIGEFNSGGIGPHEITRLPGTDTLVVANGGIETHPDAGRAMLNLPMMQPNLTYLTVDGHIESQLHLPADLRMNSIRHLAAAGDGQVAFAMQWQGPGDQHPALLGLHRMGDLSANLLTAPTADHRQMQGYAGSVAISGTKIGITSPRGGMMQVFSTVTRAHIATTISEDICGLIPTVTGFFMTTGRGTIVGYAAETLPPLNSLPVSWDNHLIPVPV